MPRITYADHTYELVNTESVLDSLLHHGAKIPHGCRSGVCQSCTMKAVKGTPNPESQKDLKPTLAAQGYFLSCRCHPAEDMEVALPGNGVQALQQATVVAKEFLTPRVLRLHLRTDAPLDYRGGQFINLHHDGLVRSYSLASVPELDEALELQIRVYADGRMSRTLADDIAVGSQLAVEGPHGSCFYVPGHPDQNLLLIATGSGLAPQWAVIRDALHHGHRGHIHLYHGSRDLEGLYLVDELRALAAEHSNFHYLPSLSSPSATATADISKGRADELAFQQLPELNGWRVFICGHPLMVANAKRHAFMAGTSLKEIHADPFVTAGDRGHQTPQHGVAAGT